MSISQNGVNDSCFDRNCDASTVEILTKYAPLVKSRALKLMTSSVELDDLIQEGNIGLLYASRRYNGDLSSFTTFARRCIDASIIDCLRRSSKLSHIPEGMLVDISDVQIADLSVDPEHAVSVKDEYMLTLEKAGNSLSGLEAVVFSDLLHGFSVDEIAERNGMNVKAVNNAIWRIRTKLK